MLRATVCVHPWVRRQSLLASYSYAAICLSLCWQHAVLHSCALDRTCAVHATMVHSCIADHLKAGSCSTCCWVVLPACYTVAATFCHATTPSLELATACG